MDVIRNNDRGNTHLNQIYTTEHHIKCSKSGLSVALTSFTATKPHSILYVNIPSNINKHSNEKILFNCYRLSNSSVCMTYCKLIPCKNAYFVHGL